MRINLKELAKSSEKKEAKLTINERLPDYFVDSCQINVNYHVEEHENYFLLYLKCVGKLSFDCLRCAQHAIIPYQNEITVAITDNETKVEQLMLEYEAIITRSYLIDLKEIITDELHLYAPRFHNSEQDCFQ